MRMKDTSLIKELLNHFNTDINQVDERGWTPLHNAVINRNGALVKILLGAFLENPLDANIQDKKGYTALHYAVILYAETFVGILLNIDPCVPNYPKVDPNLTTEQGDTALHLAVRCRSLDIIEELFKCDSGKLDVNKCNNQGDSPLSLALTQGDKNIVDRLCLHSDIEIDLLSKEMQTRLESFNNDIKPPPPPQESQPGNNP